MVAMRFFMLLIYIYNWTAAEIAQLGERVTEDHKVPGSIPGFGTEHPAARHFLLLALRIALSAQCILQAHKAWSVHSVVCAFCPRQRKPCWITHPSK